MARFKKLKEEKQTKKIKIWTEPKGNGLPARGGRGKIGGSIIKDDGGKLEIIRTQKKGGVAQSEESALKRKCTRKE